MNWKVNRVWRCLPPSSAFGRWRQEDQLKVIMSYTESLRTAQGTRYMRTYPWKNKEPTPDGLWGLLAQTQGKYKVEGQAEGSWERRRLIRAGWGGGGPGTASSVSIAVYRDHVNKESRTRL